MMTTDDTRRVLIVAGEASGDLHGANLIRAARDVDPGLYFFGMGGEKMAEAGCDLRIDMKDLAVMGLVEVLTKLPKIFKAFVVLKALLQGPERPDLLVLIDYPGFNLRLANAAKRIDIPVLYYICPKIWASRPGRKKLIVRDVDRLVTIFPFESELFRGEPIQVDYVGNPLLDEYHPPAPRSAVLERHGLDPNNLTVGLFPGSRNSELKYILPTILETAEKLKAMKPDVQFLIPVAPNLSGSDFRQALQSRQVEATLVQDDIYDIAAACDVILSVSGTVTLQIALTCTPMVILYKASPLTYAIGRRVVKIPLVGLPNIIAGKEIVKEFIQEEATSGNLTAELIRIIDNANYAKKIADDLSRVKRLLGAPGSAREVADMIFDMVS